MSSQSRMSSIFEHPLTIVAAGLIVGFILGRVTAPISTTKHLQATSEQQSKKSEGKKNAKAASRSEDEDEESDEEGVYGDFAGNDEECKLILVVRTDLGMTRGTDRTELVQLTPVLMRPHRQNRSTVLTRDASLLQSSAEAGGDQQEAVRDATPVGVLGSGESHSAGQE